MSRREVVEGAVPMSGGDKAERLVEAVPRDRNNGLTGTLQPLLQRR